MRSKSHRRRILQRCLPYTCLLCLVKCLCIELLIQPCPYLGILPYHTFTAIRKSLIGDHIIRYQQHCIPILIQHIPADRVLCLCISILFIRSHLHNISNFCIFQYHCFQCFCRSRFWFLCIGFLRNYLG